jgi:predicted dehydrogenase
MPVSKRIGVIGLGQRIAHVLAAMKEVGWSLDIAGYADPSPVGAPILKDPDGQGLRRCGGAAEGRAVRSRHDRFAEPSAL